MNKYKRPTIYLMGKQKLLSRVVMEQCLGRPLNSDEVVHHRDGNPFNNAPENLELTNRAEHKRIHSEIGKATRFKKVWVFNPVELLNLYQTKTQGELASHFGCDPRTISRALKPLIKFNVTTLRIKNNGTKRCYDKTQICQ